MVGKYLERLNMDVVNVECTISDRAHCSSVACTSVRKMYTCTHKCPVQESHACEPDEAIQDCGSVAGTAHQVAWVQYKVLCHASRQLQHSTA